MKFLTICSIFLLICVAPAATKKEKARVCSACIRAHEEFLASDSVGGRGSGTRDELIAATYIASGLRQYGVSPGNSGSYVQDALVDLNLSQEKLQKMGPAAASGKLHTRNVIG